VNPYEILNLPRDATPEDVKKAYRREASAAHPDREGGSSERMAAVNQANDVLSNPSRRKQYDEGRGTAPEMTLRMKAEAIIMGLFAEVMDTPGNPVHHVFNRVRDAEKKNLATGRQCKEQLAKAEKDVSRVRSKGPKNLFKMVAEQRVSQLKDKIKEIEEDLIVIYETRTVLQEHESDEAAVESMPSRGGIEQLIEEMARARARASRHEEKRAKEQNYDAYPFDDFGAAPPRKTSKLREHYSSPFGPQKGRNA